MICEGNRNEEQITGHHKYQNIPFHHSETFPKYLFDYLTTLKSKMLGKI